VRASELGDPGARCRWQTARRVLLVTPLRALSAQTERSFRRTFGPQTPTRSERIPEHRRYDIRVARKVAPSLDSAAKLPTASVLSASSSAMRVLPALVGRATTRSLVKSLERPAASSCDELGAGYESHQRHGLSIVQLFEPHVRFFPARLDGFAVGCGGVAVFDDYAEVKRMYTRSAARGRGVAKALLGRIEERLVGQTNRSCASKRTPTSRRRSVSNLTESQNSTSCIYIVIDPKMLYLVLSFSGSGDRNGWRIE
jgi:hypothetical protein